MSSQPSPPVRHRLLSRSTVRRIPLASQWRSRLAKSNLHVKIGLGYFVAIAIGFTGAAVGASVSDIYQGQNLARLRASLVQLRLLSQFQRYSEQAQLYSSQVATSAEHAAAFVEWRDRFAGKLRQIDNVEAELLDYIRSEPPWLADRPETMVAIVEAWTTDLWDYAQAVEALVPETGVVSLSPPERRALGSRLVTLNNRQETIYFARHRDRLEALAGAAAYQAERAEVELENAQGIEKAILWTSMVFSAAIAGTIAYFTSRSVARPIAQLAETAQQAAADDHFRAAVPELSGREVSVLARSLDCLIQRATDRTAELQATVRQVERQAADLQEALTELHRTQMQLVQTEKMSSLGQLVAGIAHEINNPINFIHGNLPHARAYTCELLDLLAVYQEKASPKLKAELESEDGFADLEFVKTDLLKLLQSMEVGTERVRSIVLSLRIFARLDEADYKAVDLHEGLDSTLMMLGGRLSAQADRPAIVVVKKYDKLPPVECYAGQLNQVFLNVLMNAIEALEEGYRAGQVAEPLTVTVTTEALPDRRVRVAIADNGPGISEAIRSRIFNPFFTTKPVGKGTGLGLSIGYQVICDRHGGRFECQSQEGQGTCFVIEIPISQHGATATPSTFMGLLREDRVPGMLPPLLEGGDRGTDAGTD